MAEELTDTEREADAQAEPPTIGALRDQAVRAHKKVQADLAAERAARDTINKSIAALVKQEAELRRFVSASTPRTRKPKG